MNILFDQMHSAKKIFTSIYEEAKLDPNIIGFFFGGSGGKGFQNLSENIELKKIGTINILKINTKMSNFI